MSNTAFNSKGGLGRPELSHALSLLIADFEQVTLAFVSLQNKQSNRVSFAKATERCWLQRICSKSNISIIEVTLLGAWAYFEQKDIKNLEGW